MYRDAKSSGEKNGNAGFVYRNQNSIKKLECYLKKKIKGGGEW